MRSLPAAAIPAGSVVRLPAGAEQTVDVEIKSVSNGTPFAGRVVWGTKDGNIEIGAAARVQVVSLP